MVAADQGVYTFLPDKKKHFTNIKLIVIILSCVKLFGGAY
jgi:hypothetical protein